MNINIVQIIEIHKQKEQNLLLNSSNLIEYGANKSSSCLIFAQIKKLIIRKKGNHLKFNVLQSGLFSYHYSV